MNFIIEIYITRNLHILWMYIPDTTTYIKFIKRVNIKCESVNYDGKEGGLGISVEVQIQILRQRKCKRKI